MYKWQDEYENEITWQIINFFHLIILTPFLVLSCPPVCRKNYVNMVLCVGVSIVHFAIQNGKVAEGPSPRAMIPKHCLLTKPRNAGTGLKRFVKVMYRSTSLYPSPNQHRKFLRWNRQTDTVCNTNFVYFFMGNTMVPSVHHFEAVKALNQRHLCGRVHFPGFSPKISIQHIFFCFRTGFYHWNWSYFVPKWSLNIWWQTCSRTKWPRPMWHWRWCRCSVKDRKWANFCF
jgi:hypothetical protein